jgi:hypothetical protein
MIRKALDIASASSCVYNRGNSGFRKSKTVCRSLPSLITNDLVSVCWRNTGGSLARNQHQQQERYVSSGRERQQIISGGDGPRISVLMELTDRVGILHDVLKYFWKYDVNITRIESRPSKESSDKDTNTITKRFDFFVDFDGQRDDASIQRLLQDLRPMTNKLLVLDEKEVHWFPRHISELDLIANRILDAGKDLDSDHPGFHDPIYRARRAQLAQDANHHTWDKAIARIKYTEEEVETWRIVWDRMVPFHEKYACKEYKVRMKCTKRKHNILILFTTPNLFF